MADFLLEVEVDNKVEVIDVDIGNDIGNYSANNDGSIDK